MFKKLVLALLACLGVSSVFAEGTNVVEVVNDIGHGVQNMVAEGVNALVPIMVAIIGIGLIVWFVPTTVSALKNAFGAGKGR